MSKILNDTERPRLKALKGKCVDLTMQIQNESQINFSWYDEERPGVADDNGDAGSKEGEHKKEFLWRPEQHRIWLISVWNKLDGNLVFLVLFYFFCKVGMFAV